MIGEGDDTDRSRGAETRDLLHYPAGAQIDRLRPLIAARIDRGDRADLIARGGGDLPLGENRRVGRPVQRNGDAGERLVDRARLAIAVRQHPVAKGESEDAADLPDRDRRRPPGKRILAQIVGEAPRGLGVAQFHGEMRGKLIGDRHSRPPIGG
jgi:hypothetical protein